MKCLLFAVSVLILADSAGFGQERSYPKAKVSFADFKGLVAEVEAHRASRLIDLDTFLKMSKEEGVLLLDSRSAFRYDRIHLKGAKHLAFTDFTQANLAKVIPSFDTKILIYCNNNFKNAKVPFPSKAPIASLNISTYIALYNYGYRNVYELGPELDPAKSKIEFVRAGK